MSPAAQMSQLLDFENFSNVLGGELVKTKSTRQSVNPSTLEPNPDVPVSLAEEVDLAVKHGKAAAALWRNVPIEERRQRVIDFANGLRALREEFALLLTKEQGKPVFVDSFPSPGFDPDSIVA